MDAVAGGCAVEGIAAYIAVEQRHSSFESSVVLAVVVEALLMEADPDGRTSVALVEANRQEGEKRETHLEAFQSFGPEGVRDRFHASAPIQISPLAFLLDAGCRCEPPGMYLLREVNFVCSKIHPFGFGRYAFLPKRIFWIQRASSGPNRAAGQHCEVQYYLTFPL